LHHINGNKYFSPKQLKPNKYFPKGLKIISPKIYDSPSAIGWKKNGNIVTIKTKNQKAKALINEYTTDDVLFRTDAINLFGVPQNFSEIKFRNGSYYFNFYGNVLSVAPQVPDLEKFPFQGVRFFEIAGYSQPIKIAAATAEEIFISYKSSNNQPIYFTHQFHAKQLKFIGENYLVGMRDYKLVVFDVKGEHPRMMWERDFDQKLVSVLNVSKRSSFGILDEYGKMMEMNIE